jgi:hypothetical protein
MWGLILFFSDHFRSVNYEKANCKLKESRKSWDFSLVGQTDHLRIISSPRFQNVFEECSSITENNVLKAVEFAVLEEKAPVPLLEENNYLYLFWIEDKLNPEHAKNLKLIEAISFGAGYFYLYPFNRISFDKIQRIFDLLKEHGLTNAVLAIKKNQRKANISCETSNNKDKEIDIIIVGKGKSCKIGKIKDVVLSFFNNLNPEEGFLLSIFPLLSESGEEAVFLKLIGYYIDKFPDLWEKLTHEFIEQGLDVTSRISFKKIDSKEFVYGNK